MRDVECFFDCSSPWTYLGFHNLQPLAAELGATVRWRPILVVVTPIAVVANGAMGVGVRLFVVPVIRFVPVVISALVL